MNKLTFKIPLYEQTVTLVQIEGKEDVDAVLQLLKEIKVDQENINDTIDNIKRGCFNGGDTFRNFEIRRMLVVFYPMTTPRVKENLYSHEKRHIEDRVLEWAHVDDIEAAAFLAGFLGEKFYEFQNKKK